MTLPSGVNQGDVYTLLEAQFSDGKTAPSKYIVVMGCYKGNVAGFFTTSQEKGQRDRREGCNPGRGFYPWNYYLKTKAAPFIQGTWVVLELQCWPIAAFANRLAGNKAFWVCTFEDALLRAIRNCFEKSPEWADAYGDFMYGGKTPICKAPTGK